MKTNKFSKAKLWKPKLHDKYWIVTYYGEILRYKYHNDSIDNRMIRFGNYFKTKKDAEEVAKKIRKLLKEGGYGKKNNA